MGWPKELFGHPVVEASEWLPGVEKIEFGDCSCYVAPLGRVRCSLRHLPFRKEIRRLLLNDAKGALGRILDEVV